jgi:glycosyltransferase involved in cell wall biosynthesis
LNAEKPERSPFSVGVCLPVWNRPDLFTACYASLTRQLAGVEATIWIFDNGSDTSTRRLIADLEDADRRLIKISFPQNMGIPYVANVFSGMVAQDCTYAGHRAPSHVMLVDADIYFKESILDMLEILEADEGAGIISGHDSVEHKTLREYRRPLRGKSVLIKEKTAERGACLIMRTDVFAACVPFPHDVPYNVDWQLMTKHANSMAARKRKVLALDYVVHMGLYDSTWHPIGVPADQREVEEINRILNREGLLSPSRKSRMESYCRKFNFRPDFSDQ